MSIGNGICVGILTLSAGILMLMSCASNDECPFMGKDCAPQSVRECTTRVIESLGRPAYVDPHVDRNYDGEITGADFTLCRSGVF